jgi:hypothetical protein
VASTAATEAQQLEAENERVKVRLVVKACGTAVVGGIFLLLVVCPWSDQNVVCGCNLWHVDNKNRPRDKAHGVMWLPCAGVLGFRLGVDTRQP